MVSLVTIPPRLGKGRKPKTSSGSSEVGAVTASPLRASSEMTWPAVLFSRLASSFAAVRTSSARSRVVLMHLMLLHQGTLSSNSHLAVKSADIAIPIRMFVTNVQHPGRETYGSA